MREQASAKGTPGDAWDRGLVLVLLSDRLQAYYAISSASNEMSVQRIMEYSA